MAGPTTRRFFLRALLGAPAALSAIQSCATSTPPPSPGPAPPAGPPILPGCDTRKTWSNYVGTQTAQPLAMCSPETPEAVSALVRETAGKRLSMKAVGSGHSWSDVALTDGVMVLPDRMRAVLPLERELLKPSAPPMLFRAQSGITIHELNDALADAGRGLINMGGYDGQTIAGAISTGTHGSGLEFGPLCDFVESLEIVPADGKLCRIEPSAGITDPAKFAGRHPEVRLIQDDDYFYSAVVSLGCLGVITSYILRVREKYFLTERRFTKPWPEVREDLIRGDVFRQNRHYEVLLNPYPTNGVNLCLVTTRNPAKEPIQLSPSRERNFLVVLASFLPAGILDCTPQQAPEILNSALKILVEDERGFTRVSYEVLNIGAPNRIQAISAELAFPMKNGIYLAAVERFLELAGLQRAAGGRCHSSPVSLRFVRGTKAYLAPENGGDTCMMEIIFGRETVGVKEMLYAYETQLAAFGARPHWGQLNFVSGGHAVLSKMYPDYPKWLAVHKEFSRDHLFDSVFARRVGISDYEFVSPGR
ncbi:MAG TPA: FAD-binding protein [Thermoanaerobaculia bacterium]|nr:FAD-binding protein [Thermoanaerobaculia bacterium]